VPSSSLRPTNQTKTIQSTSRTGSANAFPLSPSDLKHVTIASCTYGRFINRSFIDAGENSIEKIVLPIIWTTAQLRCAEHSKNMSYIDSVHVVGQVSRSETPELSAFGALVTSGNL